MIKLVPLFFCLLILPLQVKAKEPSAQGLMAISKIAGACGILDSMLHFQKTTKMQGGDEFIARFWAAEMARLGLSMKKYSDRCDKAITTYDKFWKALETPK